MAIGLPNRDSPDKLDSLVEIDDLLASIDRDVHGVRSDLGAVRIASGSVIVVVIQDIDAQSPGGGGAGDHGGGEVRLGGLVHAVRRETVGFLDDDGELSGETAEKGAEGGQEMVLDRGRDELAQEEGRGGGRGGGGDYQSLGGGARADGRRRGGGRAVHFGNFRFREGLPLKPCAV